MSGRNDAPVPTATYGGVRVRSPRSPHRAPLLHAAGRAFSRFVKIQTLRTVVLHPERRIFAGGALLAVTHVSHLEPVVVSTIVPRPVRWMARVEFFKYRWAARLLVRLGAFPVNRTGIPVAAIRLAISMARRGEVVGIFPEGGVKKREQAVFRGGPMKRGACVIAQRARVPVVPVVVLGTEKLNRVAPWLPARRGRVWVAFGETVHPPPERPRRAGRLEMAGRLQAEFERTYRELLEHSGLRDKDVP